ncbi:lipoprotein [Neisseria gonorrhoeae]
MKYGVFFAAATALLLSACGYKGGLYLPKEGDTARFGAIQTGAASRQTAIRPTNPKMKTKI